MNKHLYSFWDILSYVVKWTLVFTIGIALYYMGKDINETKRTVQAIHWTMKDMF